MNLRVEGYNLSINTIADVAIYLQDQLSEQVMCRYENLMSYSDIIDELQLENVFEGFSKKQVFKALSLCIAGGRENGNLKFVGLYDDLNLKDLQFIRKSSFTKQSIEDGVGFYGATELQKEQNARKGGFKSAKSQGFDSWANVNESLGFTPAALVNGLAELNECRKNMGPDLEKILGVVAFYEHDTTKSGVKRARSAYVGCQCSEQEAKKALQFYLIAQAHGHDTFTEASKYIDF